MKIAVVGLWHLGCVTAACLAEGGHDVIGYDKNADVIAQLQKHQAPLFEPGLNELISKGISQQKLLFTSDIHALADAELIWITYDTPVDDNDIADVDFVKKEITETFVHLKQNAVIVISSQVPVGTTEQLAQICAQHYPQKNIVFACSPENLRLGKALQVFMQPDRVIVGIDPLQTAAKTMIQTALKPFTQNIVWMSVASAEMTKHALNAFLATSVVFINELAILCERVGANANEVELGLKSEERIGPKAYLKPGNAIAGGTLARDVNFLMQLGETQQLETPLFSSLLASNHVHKQWACRRLTETLKNLKNKTITTLGLTYKAGTSTLRRSTAVETCQWLHQQGARVVAYDPALTELPAHLQSVIDLKSTLAAAINETDAILVSTEWPEFKDLQAEDIVNTNSSALVFDPNGFLAKNLSGHAAIQYFCVGRAT